MYSGVIYKMKIKGLFPRIPNKELIYELNKALWSATIPRLYCFTCPFYVEVVNISLTKINIQPITRLIQKSAHII